MNLSHCKWNFIYVYLMFFIKTRFMYWEKFDYFWWHGAIFRSYRSCYEQYFWHPACFIRYWFPPHFFPVRQNKSWTSNLLYFYIKHSTMDFKTSCTGIHTQKLTSFCDLFLLLWSHYTSTSYFAALFQQHNVHFQYYDHSELLSHRGYIGALFLLWRLF